MLLWEKGKGAEPMRNNKEDIDYLCDVIQNMCSDFSDAPWNCGCCYYKNNVNEDGQCKIRLYVEQIRNKNASVPNDNKDTF